LRGLIVSCISPIFKTTSTEVIEAYIRRIENVNKLINAVVIKNFSNALETARQVDEYIRNLNQDSDEFKQVMAKNGCVKVPILAP
jgi:hypothetical protein